VAVGVAVDAVARTSVVMTLPEWSGRAAGR
jgi:hypothetical protein